MEFYDSVRDVFESEVQTEMDQILRSEAARFTPQPDIHDDVDVVELSCTDGANENVWDPTVTLAENTLAGTTSTHSITTTSTTNAVDFVHLTSPDKYGLDGNSLLVDPQTGLPVNTLNLQSNNGNNSAQQQLNLIVSAADSSGQTVQQQIPVSLSLGNINMNLSSQQQGLYTQSALLTVTAAQQQQQQQQSRNQPQQITFQNAAATLQGLQAAFTQVPLQNQNLQTQTTASMGRHGKIELEPKNGLIEKVWAKPAYSYSCLITMALKNSKTGCLPVSEIYQFMCENFPYFKTAPDGWKNSVRHNLSLNKCFAKIEKPASSNSGTRKGCLWALNPEKTAKMEEEVVKWTKKDPAGIRRAMANPDELERIEAAVTGNHHTPHLATAVQSMEPKVTQTTATATRPTPKIEPKITISDDFASGHQMTPDLFGSDINILDPAMVTFEGDFNLQVYADQLGLDPLTCGDIMNLDVPLTTTTLPSNPVMSSFLEASPIKDTSSLGNLNGLDPQQYAQSQFCSPSRTSVTAFM